MRSTTLIVVSSIAVLSNSFSALADGVQDCDKALIVATYNRTDQLFSDWRLAENVDESSYNFVKNSAGLNVVIYGVPIGADYKGFKESINNLKRNRTESLKKEEFRNVAWTGLDDNSVKAYAECIRAVSKKNLLLVPRTATASDVSFELIYTVIGRSRNPLPVKWSGVETRRNMLPSRIDAGSTPIIVRRPTTESTLGIKGDGLGDQIVLTPLPAPLPEESKYLSRCVVNKTPTPLPQVSKGGSASWLCPSMQSGEYNVRASIPAKVNSGAGFRIGYSFDAKIGTGARTRSVSLPVGQGIADYNIPGGGMPTAFSTDERILVAAGEPVQIILRINGVANSCCWDRTNHNDGTIAIPEDVDIVVERLGILRPN